MRQKRPILILVMTLATLAVLGLPAFAQRISSMTPTSANIGSTVTSGSGLAADSAPIVNAGPDQNVSIAQGATVSGTVIGDGNALSIYWSTVTGPSAATFEHPAALNTT